MMKTEGITLNALISTFLLCHCFDIRHSSFVICPRFFLRRSRGGGEAPVSGIDVNGLTDERDAEVLLPFAI